MEKLPSQPSRWWDWPAVILLFVLLETAAARLVDTTWTPFLHLIEGFTYIGFALGAALGYSRFQRGTARWLTFFYMLIMLPLQWTLVIAQEESLEGKLASVAGRLYYATSAFVERHPVQDPIFFVAIMSIAFWIISSWSVFTLVRSQNYLGAVLPAAIGLFVIQGYDNTIPSRLWFLAVFTFLALLLLGRLQFLKNKSSWRERHIFLSPDNSFDLTSSMAVMAGLLILVAWSIPASVSGLNSAVRTWNRVTRPWHEFTQRMENAVSALESPNRGKPTEFYGTDLKLGLGFPNSPSVMFTVHVPDLPLEQQPPRYYWRGRVYDHFANGDWSATGTKPEDYFPAPEQQQAVARFAFQIGESRMSLLYAPSQPVWVSRSGTRQVSPTDLQDKEVLSWLASPALLPGETYQVESLVKNPTTEQLRGTGTEYPGWITNKYLQLPEDFSPRIAALAKDITATANTPYDKASAITNYLRQTIKYAPTIQRPPRGQDALEWVLFDYKQAYCVYYATSEVLMLRSLGIPARMAVGFAQGSVVTVDVGPGQQPRVIPGTYVVMRNNAHAWPEVYFPEIGWVEFEPTAGQAPLDRPLPPQEQTDANNLANKPRTEDNQEAPIEPDTGSVDAPVTPETRFLPLYILLPFLVVCAALTIFLSRRFSFEARVPVFLRLTLERTGIDVPIWVVRWESWVKLSPIEKAFESINSALRLLDQAAPVHITPIERAAKLTRILPDQADQIKILLDEHQTSLYTSRIGDVTQARRAAFDIRKQAIIERMRRFFFGKPLS
ncbi:MAG TPA: transglutaminase domain-containing protein [Anaerolineales bacterium]|nr:transglutaminase domain-containing protein [Anaerolineales bacterium]